jgi:hypothetical protein
MSRGVCMVQVLQFAEVVRSFDEALGRHSGGGFIRLVQSCSPARRRRWTDRYASGPSTASIDLTHGSDADWAKNVRAAGGCQLQTRGCIVPLVVPHLYHDEQRRGIRSLERHILRLLGVADLLTLETASEPPERCR